MPKITQLDKDKTRTVKCFGCKKLFSRTECNLYMYVKHGEWYSDNLQEKDLLFLCKKCEKERDELFKKFF